MDVPSARGERQRTLSSRFVESFPHARVIMLTTCDADGEVQRALLAGAVAYLLKSTPKTELVSVIRFVHSGQRYISPDVSACLAEHLGEDSLTTREIEVLRLIRDGPSQ